MLAGRPGKGTTLQATNKRMVNFLPLLSLPRYLLALTAGKAETQTCALGSDRKIEERAPGDIPFSFLVWKREMGLLSIRKSEVHSLMFFCYLLPTSPGSPVGTVAIPALVNGQAAEILRKQHFLTGGTVVPRAWEDLIVSPLSLSSHCLVPEAGTFSFQNCKKVNFFCLSYPVCGLLLWQLA